MQEPGNDGPRLLGAPRRKWRILWVDSIVIGTIVAVYLLKIHRSAPEVEKENVTLGYDFGYLMADVLMFFLFTSILYGIDLGLRWLFGLRTRSSE